MSDTPAALSGARASHARPSGARAPELVLRRLFLMLFLRGRTARGLGHAEGRPLPKSLARRLWVVLLWHTIFGLMALFFLHQPVFALATYLHAMTFMVLGMFVATSAGEVLFNRDEADILLHRPVTPRALLWARIAVLVQVSLLLALAFNLVGLIVGLRATDARWWFPAAHAGAVALEAVFTTATVVVVYQLCLRWFGRERLESLMTGTQVVVAILVVLGGQLVPQLMFRFEGTQLVRLDSWWVSLLPPAWFASIDDAVAGNGGERAWLLAAVAAVATVSLTWVALIRLATDYQVGMQTLSESSTRKRPATRLVPLDGLLAMPPLGWWLRDSVARASFRLTAAYLVRDRDAKLRFWPGIAPILVIPLVAILPSSDDGGMRGSAGLAFGGSYLALLPVVAMGLIETSQQWMAADLFRLAPVVGPASLSRGVRVALLVLVALPMAALYGGIALLTGSPPSDLLLLLPGLIALPVFGMVACLGGRGVPLSRAPDSSRMAFRVFHIAGAMIGAGILGGLSAWASRWGWLPWLLLGEVVIGAVLYTVLREAVMAARWQSLE